MKLTDITTSLELAKELKEVGFPQESLYYWSEISDDRSEILDNESVKSNFSKKDMKFVYAAPTAEELLEWLPDHINPPFKRNDLFLFFLPVLNDYDIEPTVAKTFTEALAKMVIYLAKNKIIKFETK